MDISLTVKLFSFVEMPVLNVARNVCWRMKLLTREGPQRRINVFILM